MLTRSLLLLLVVYPLAAAVGSPTDSLRQVLARTGQDTARVNTLNELGALYTESDPDSAIIHGSEARTLAERLRFRPGLAEALRVIGFGHMGKQEYGIAITHLDRSLALWAELGDIEKQKRVHFALAHCAEQQSELPEALEHYLASLKFANGWGTAPPCRTCA